MVDSKVVINDEAFDLVTIPDAKSKMVMKTKDLLLGSLDLQSLVDDLGKLGSFIRVAYNGVAGHTEEQIQVQNVGYKVTELADKSAVTVYQFKGASQNILQELKSTYQYLLDGYDDMALKTLSMMTEVAAAMAKAATELQKDFNTAKDEVVVALKTLQKAKGAEQTQKQTREEEQRDFESRVKQAKQRQKNALEAEAKAQLLYDKAQEKEDEAFDNLKQESFLSTVGRIFNGMISAASNVMTLNIGKAAEAIEKISHESGYKEAMKMANQEKMKYLDELQKEREIRQKALDECIEFAEKIKRCPDDNALAEAAIEALHSSIGALKSLSTIMMKAAVFWQQMQCHCDDIAKGYMQEMVQEAVNKYDDHKRMKFWTSTGFKKRAVQYYSKWVALDDVCGVYMLQIRDTRQDLYNYLEENPTIEQAKKNVRHLASELAKDLKQAQEKLAKEKEKALEEKKSLEDKWLLKYRT